MNPKDSVDPNRNRAGSHPLKNTYPLLNTSGKGSYFGLCPNAVLLLADHNDIKIFSLFLLLRCSFRNFIIEFVPFWRENRIQFIFFLCRYNSRSKDLWRDARWFLAEVSTLQYREVGLLCAMVENRNEINNNSDNNCLLFQTLSPSVQFSWFQFFYDFRIQPAKVTG